MSDLANIRHNPSLEIRRTNAGAFATSQLGRFAKKHSTMIASKKIIRPLSFLIKFTLIFVFALLASLSITGCKEKHTDSDSRNLHKALRERGMNFSEEIDYNDLVDKLKDMSAEVPGSYENATMTYLDSHADSLIQLPTSKPGILSWHFEKIFFIEKDLVFASFSDGEMYGGDLLVEIVQTDHQIKSMNTIWNYHK